MQMTRDIGPFHIIGIGGIGMSAIAEILLAKGYSVQGSDQKDSANVRRLRAKGVRVFVGHDAVNLVGARLVVISTAVKPNNPELEAARAKGLPIVRRAVGEQTQDLMVELLRARRGIFALSAGEQHLPTVVVRPGWSVDVLLFEALRQIDEWSVIESEVPSFEARFALQARSSADHAPSTSPRSSSSLCRPKPA